MTQKSFETIIKELDEQTDIDFANGNSMTQTMVGITQSNFSEIATSNYNLDHFNAKATLEDILNLLADRYPDDVIGDSIAIKVDDYDDEELYYCDCNVLGTEIEIETLLKREVDSLYINEDWYQSSSFNEETFEDDEELEIEKKGYVITLKEEISYEL